jgi:hypothetical protein
MPVTAHQTDAWYSDGVDCQEIISARVEGGVSVYYKREHHVMTLSRKLVGVSRFEDELGARKTSFSYRTGADTSVTYAGRSGKKVFRCTGDRLTMTDSITGEQLQVQTWEHFTDEEELPESEYKAPE